MAQIFSDPNNYEEISEDPTPTLKNDIISLAKKWNESKFCKLDTSAIKNSNLPRAYGLVKTHKPNNPMRVIVSCINSRVSELSDFYKNILTAACPRPKHVIKNSLDFKNKIKNIKIPHHHIMGSLDVILLFASIPYELVHYRIKNRWNKIKKHTN